MLSWLTGGKAVSGPLKNECQKLSLYIQKFGFWNCLQWFY